MSKDEALEEVKGALQAVLEAGFHNGELDFKVSEEAEELIKILTKALYAAEGALEAE